MSATVKSDISGLFGALAHNGVDAITFDSTGILPGSYKDGSIVDTDLALSANSAPVKTALNAAGGAPIFACRAWVNFNGTGTVAIRASGNVSSITDHGTGYYTVNFMTAMPDANYAANVNIYGIDSARNYSSTVRYESLLSTYCQVTVGRGDNTGGFIHGDSSIVTVSIFR